MYAGVETCPAEYEEAVQQGTARCGNMEASLGAIIGVNGAIHNGGEMFEGEEFQYLGVVTGRRGEGGCGKMLKGEQRSRFKQHLQSFISVTC